MGRQYNMIICIEILPMLAQKSSLPNINVLNRNLLLLDKLMVELHNSGKLIIAIAVSIYIIKFICLSCFMYRLTASVN